MPIDHNAKLTAPEVACLWSQYQSDTMANCVSKYMLNIVEDLDIRPIIELFASIAQRHISVIKQFLVTENYPTPQGFTDKDVFPTAPRIFSDILCLTYAYIMSINGLGGYAGAIATSMRADIREYYIQCLNETLDLFNKSLDLLMKKGIVSRPPVVNPQSKVEFVQKQSFMSGLLGESRPLSCIEISHLYWDLKKIQTSKAITMAFSQVANSQQVREYLWRGVEIYSKQIEILDSVMKQENLPTPKSEESEVTNSTVSPFSDKLLMFHKELFGTTSIGFYGLAIGASARSDLVSHYIRLNAEMLKFAEDGANIMIENEWLEQPPLATDRRELAVGK